MVRSRDVVQAEGSARTEGARRATGVRADGAAAGAGSLAPGQRWSAIAGSATWCCGCCVANRWRRCPVQAGVEIYRARRVAGAGHGWPRTRLKGSSRRASGGGARRGEASQRGAADGRSAAAVVATRAAGRCGYCARSSWGRGRCSMRHSVRCLTASKPITPRVRASRTAPRTWASRKSSSRRNTCTYSRVPGLPSRASTPPPQPKKLLRQRPPDQGRRLVERPGLALQHWKAK